MCNKKSIHSMIVDVLINSLFLLNGLHSEMVLDVPELREGIPGNITCSVSKLKHPAKFELSLDNKPLPETGQQDIYDSASATLTSIKTLTDISRSWNNKSFKCVSLTMGPAGNYVFHAFKNQTIIYKYPPSSMRMVRPETPINMMSWYPLTIVCVANDSNADCRITWASDLPDINLRSATRVGHRNILSTLHVNVPQGNSGHNISCRTECVEFAVNFTKVYTIDLPRPPTIQIRPTNKTAVTMNLALECEVDSNPIGNISWIDTQTNETEIKCDNMTVCLLKLNETTVDSSTNYACLAGNIHGQDRKRFNATDANGDKATEGSGGKLLFMNALIASVVSVVVCFGLVLGCFVYKRKAHSDEVISTKECAQMMQRTFNHPHLADREGQLIYADIDIEFLEQNRAARSPPGDTDHTVYTSVRFAKGTERNPQ